MVSVSSKLTSVSCHFPNGNFARLDIQSSSFTCGDGIPEGLEWLQGQLTEDYVRRTAPPPSDPAPASEADAKTSYSEPELGFFSRLFGWGASDHNLFSTPNSTASGSAPERSY